MKTTLKTTLFVALFAVAGSAMAAGLHDYDGLPSAVHAASTGGDSNAAQQNMAPQVQKEYNDKI